MSERKLYVKILPTVFNPNADSNTDVVYVNDDFNPLLIHNQFFTGNVVFRVVDFDGITPIKEGKKLPIKETSYFENRGRKFSLQIDGRFRHSWNGEDVLFGVFFEKPIQYHPAFKVALSMARYIDPSLVGDIFSSSPYLCSPLLCAMNVMAKQKAPMRLKDAASNTAKFYKNDRDFLKEYEESKISSVTNLDDCVCCENGSSVASDDLSSDEADLNDISDSTMDKKLAHRLGSFLGLNSSEDPLKEMGSISLSRKRNCLEFANKRPLLLPQWKYGANTYLEENLVEIEAKKNFDFSFLSYRKEATHKELNGNDYEARLKVSKKNSKKRRRHFLKQEHREAFSFEPENVYGFEFSSSYANLNNLELKLGVKIDIEKVINQQPIIYEARTRSGIVFWRVELGLTPAGTRKPV